MKLLPMMALLLLAACTRPAPVRSIPVPARPIQIAAPERTAKVYIPIALDRYDVPATSTKKGCGGCTVKEMETVSAAWSYVWHPRSRPGALPLVKPDYHTAAGAEVSAQREGWLLWANEPDLEGPTPKRAAALYPEAEALGVKLVLATGSQLDENQEWVRQFRKEYRRLHGRWPRIDSLGVHCYYSSNTVSWCVRHVQDILTLAKEWGVNEVWISEFGCAPANDPACRSASGHFISFLEATPLVSRYAWFAAREDERWPWPPDLSDGALFDREGELTEVGEWYKAQ